MSQQIIDDYLQAVVGSIKNGGSTKFWPISPGQTDTYFNDFLAINIFEKFKQDQDKFKKALGFLPPHILRWFLLPFCVLGLKLARNYEGYKISSEEMINLIQCVYEILADKIMSDPFCLDGQNIILSKTEIKHLLKTNYWFDGKDRKVVSLLSLDLESFIWSINFDIYAYGVCWHGPYLSPDQKTLMVKSFLDLKSPVWNLQVPYDRIDIFYQFKGEVDINIDFMTHITYPSSIWEKLVCFSLLIEDRQVTDFDEIEKIDNSFITLRATQVKLVNNLSPQNLIRKSAEIYYYMFHDFFKYYKESYYPPKDLQERLKKAGLKYWNQAKPQDIMKQPDENFFRKLYDPRNNYTD